MTSDLFGLSPMSTLSASIRGGLAPGQLGMVMARAGVGKSAFLVHVALGHLLRGTEVLHVSLQDQAAHVRSFYDEILGELLRTSGAQQSSAQVEVERNRVIHSFLSGPFTTDRLTHLLATLDEVMHFRPTVVVIDGSVDATDVVVDDRDGSTLLRDACPHRTEPRQLRAIQQHEGVKLRETRGRVIATNRSMSQQELMSLRHRVRVDDLHLLPLLHQEVVERHLRAQAIAVGALVTAQQEAVSGA